MRRVPRFYLNESILDDLMNDPEYAGNAQTASDRIAQDVVTSSTDNYDYPHIFEFRIKALPKSKPVEWYFTRLRNFQDYLVELLSMNRYIRDFNHKIVFHILNWRSNEVPVVEVEERGLYFQIYNDETVDGRLASSSNDIYVRIGMNVVIDTVFQLRKIMMSLYRIFQNSVRASFKTQGNPQLVQYIPKEKSQYICNINHNDYETWKTMPKTFDRSMKNMFRAVHPELKPKEIQKELDEWRDAKLNSDDFKGDRRAIELLKNLGLYMDNETVTFRESDKSVIVKIGGYRKWEPTKLDKLIEFIDNYEYAITIKGLSRLHIGFNYVDNQLEDVYKLLSCIDTDCRKILVQIQNSMQLMNKYNGQVINLVKLFPGYKVSATAINMDPLTVVKNPEDYDFFDYSFKVNTTEGLKQFSGKAFKLKNSKR